MAKSTAHVDKLGSLSDFKAPWESEAGADAEIDKGKLKNLIFNLKRDFALERDKHEDTKVTLTEAETARDEAKSQAADGSGAEAQKTIDKLTKERDDLKAERDSLVSDKEAAELRKEVLGDFEVENPKAAKYVVGTTKEELEESLAAVKEDFGISDEPADEDKDEDDDTPQVRTRPRTLVTAIDKDASKTGAAEVDYDAVAEAAIAAGGLRY